MIEFDSCLYIVELILWFIWFVAEVMSMEKSNEIEMNGTRNWHSTRMNAKFRIVSDHNRPRVMWSQNECLPMSVIAPTIWL